MSDSVFNISKADTSAKQITEGEQTHPQYKDAIEFLSKCPCVDPTWAIGPLLSRSSAFQQPIQRASATAQCGMVSDWHSATLQFLPKLWWMTSAMHTMRSTIHPNRARMHPSLRLQSKSRGRPRLKRLWSSRSTSSPSENSCASSLHRNPMQDSMRVWCDRRERRPATWFADYDCYSHSGYW